MSHYMSGQTAQNLNGGIKIHILHLCTVGLEKVEMHNVCLEIKTVGIDMYTVHVLS